MAEDALLDEREVAILRWRSRRGLVENDLFIERFFNRHGAQLRASQARAVTMLMNLSDNDLLDLLLVRKEPEGEIATDDVRAVLKLLRERA
ncbi:MAG: succinate dehydrogenase assembly factor 2 [Proteobacteria bacterium]|nr:succinate dehydrogenase assembly factor 2 [Pseudomonadota bacterium]MBS0493948.1 succinate dehydrogenase assembly factor 2 [Pseudomonadota bacterium]